MPVSEAIIGWYFYNTNIVIGSSVGGEVPVSDSGLLSRAIKDRNVFVIDPHLNNYTPNTGHGHPLPQVRM